MSYLQNFLSSFIKHIPRIHNLSARVNATSNLLVNYPLVLNATASNRLAVISQSKIHKDNLIVLLAAGECIFSQGFSGASASQEKKINQDLKNLSEQYESMNKNFMDRMKIYLQLLAGKQTIQHGEMPLKDFTEYIFGGEEKTLNKGDINSRYLNNLYVSWEINNKLTFSYLNKGFLKRTEEEEFLDAIKKGKQFIRGTGKAPFLFAAPFLDKFDHSFDPNCEFDMIYMPHRRSPFVCIRSIRDILPNQRPTLNYGNLNNYELLLRYGFCIKNNPFSVFMLPLNFQNIVEIFNKNIQWKQKQMLTRELRLKNFVKILPSGQIAPDDLLMMRILICDAQNPTEDRLNSDLYDQLIYKFIRGHAEHMKNNLKINNYLVSKNKDVKILEDEEISILGNFLSQHTS